MAWDADWRNCCTRLRVVEVSTLIVVFIFHIRVDIGGNPNCHLLGFPRSQECLLVAQRCSDRLRSRRIKASPQIVHQKWRMSCSCCRVPGKIRDEWFGRRTARRKMGGIVRLICLQFNSTDLTARRSPAQFLPTNLSESEMGSYS